MSTLTLDLFLDAPPAVGFADSQHGGERDAGILEDDFVVVRPQETADDGEIVVALLGEEATVKRFFREADHVRLQPENETMEPIRTRDARVIGRVVGVLRKVA